MKKRILAALVAMIVGICSVEGVVGQSAGKGASSNNKEKNSYIIVTNNDEDSLEVVNEFDAEMLIEGETPDSSNNFLVAELTKNEVTALAQDDDIMIEEDLIIEANVANIEKKDNKIKQKLYKQWLKEEKEQKKIRKNAETEWNLKAIDVDEVDKLNNNVGNNKKAKIAILDSGVDIVPGIDLIESINFVEDEDDMPIMFADLSGHGTGIASVIGGTEESWVQGVNPQAELYSVKVLNEQNKAPVSRIIKGIYWCIENDIDIINMSFGTPIYSQSLEKAVEDAYAVNILMVAAAGNNNSDVEYPAAFDEVMAVASTNTKSELSDFSNEGEALDVAAPGEKVRITGFFGETGVTSGTSIAVPQVVGVASMLWEKDLTKSNEFIRQLISYSAKKINNTDDCGLIDAQYAFSVYDKFKDVFDSIEIKNINTIPENMEETESFEYINDDSNYVEGRWSGDNHELCVTDGVGPADITSADRKALLKLGIRFVDQDEDLFSRRDIYHGGSTDGNISGNYMANYEFLTRVALNGGDSDSLSRAQGQTTNAYETMQYDIDDTFVGTKQWANYLPSLGYTNNATNRRSFCWGMALHILTDSFAHATRRKSDGALIKKDEFNPDNINLCPSRFKVAKKAVQYSLMCLKTGTYGDWTEYEYGLQDKWESDFLKIKLKTCAAENADMTIPSSYWVSKANSNS